MSGVVASEGELNSMVKEVGALFSTAVDWYDMTGS